MTRPHIPRYVVHAVATLMLACLLLPAGGAAPVPASAAGATYKNPVFARPFPDPFVLKVGSAYYAYGTTMPWQALDRLFPILKSSDLVHWRYVADAMTSAPAWGTDDWWAPDVIKRHGTYYLFYTGKGLDADQHCIAVATAHTPSGPFTDHGVLGCGDRDGQGYIDPDPFIDGNGKAYLYLSVDNPYHSISVLPLSEDLLHTTGPRKELFTLSQEWEFGPAFSTVEGPFMIRRGTTYYLFYSGNDWQHDYAMGYATATSPTGPFVKYRQNPILRGNKSVIGPGGGSLVQGPHGTWWLAYHAWPADADFGAGDQRSLRLDPVTWQGSTVSVTGPSTVAKPTP